MTNKSFTLIAFITLLVALATVPGSAQSGNSPDKRIQVLLKSSQTIDISYSAGTVTEILTDFPQMRTPYVRMYTYTNAQVRFARLAIDLREVAAVRAEAP